MVSAVRPETFAEALQMRQEYQAIPCAGGTDLMASHRRHSGLVPRFERPVLLLNHLQEMRHVSVYGPELVIGAAVTLTELLGDWRVPSALLQAIAQMAAPAIRNVATLAGNLCNASPAGDALPALYCLNADVVLARTEGERRINVEDFVRGPGETDLRDDELVKAVVVPVEQFDVVYYRKVGTRKANALAKVAFLGLASTDGEILRELRIAFGAVAPTIVRSRQLESECIGRSRQELTQMRTHLLDAYSGLIAPIDDQRSTAYYRKGIALRLLDHFLTEMI